MVFNSISKIETNRFARADLENMLAVVDDDMDMSALPKTNHIKTIVTLESKMDLETKGKQSVQRAIYSRIICFSNGTFSALHDQSDGFFRRQIVLTAKEKDRDRVADPHLIEKLEEELEGIFLWCLEGLKRLLANDYRFSVSDRAKQNLLDVMKATNNFEEFLESEGYFRLEENCMATSKKIYGAYLKWCEDNVYKPKASTSLTTYLKDKASQLNLRYSTNIPTEHGKKARGFMGINVMIRTE